MQISRAELTTLSATFPGLRGAALFDFEARVVGDVCPGHDEQKQVLREAILVRGASLCASVRNKQSAFRRVTTGIEKVLLCIVYARVGRDSLAAMMNLGEGGLLRWCAQRLFDAGSLAG